MGSNEAERERFTSYVRDREYISIVDINIIVIYKGFGSTLADQQSTYSAANISTYEPIEG